MDSGTRSRQGYEIIESYLVGNMELVIGHNPKASILMYASTVKVVAVITGGITAAV